MGDRSKLFGGPGGCWVQGVGLWKHWLLADCVGRLEKDVQEWALC
jgi:hypothetical protein